jgi:hypothetical protein
VLEVVIVVACVLVLSVVSVGVSFCGVGWGDGLLTWISKWDCRRNNCCRYRIVSAIDVS